MLDEAVKELPNAHFWIKSDGSDVVPGSMESTRGEWCGDVDLGDGAVEKQHEAYTKYLQLIDGLFHELRV